MITYQPRPNGSIRVFLDKRAVGTIHKLAGEYRYQPFGGKPGDWFATLAECKRSLGPSEPETHSNDEEREPGEISGVHA